LESGDFATCPSEDDDDMKYVLIYYVISLNLGFTGQAYFDSKELCDKAREQLTHGGSVRAVCLQSQE
jgi:hypothetical protein